MGVLPTSERQRIVVGLPLLGAVGLPLLASVGLPLLAVVGLPLLAVVGCRYSPWWGCDNSGRAIVAGRWAFAVHSLGETGVAQVTGGARVAAPDRQNRCGSPMAESIANAQNTTAR